MRLKVTTSLAVRDIEAGYRHYCLAADHLFYLDNIGCPAATFSAGTRPPA
ncbi:hypothetical protein [Neorhizobium sp. SOG26]|nr:hypothetical protein [Neorhizobium sp. SOG26]